LENTLKLLKNHSTFGASTESSAKKMTGPGLGAALEACLLADDSRSAETSSRFACCSRDAGICVVCPQPPSANNVCDVTNYRVDPLTGGRPISASGITTIRQQMQLPPRTPKPPNAANPAAPASGVLPNAK
jgi:hypothetical protein